MSSQKITKEWADLMRALDVTPEKAQGIEKLDPDKKRHLLESYITKNEKCSALHCVNLLKGLKINNGATSKKRYAHQLQIAAKVLMDTEISLRTNDVVWMYIFLDLGGVEAVGNYIFRVMHIEIESEGKKTLGAANLGRSRTLSNQFSRSFDLTLDGVGRGKGNPELIGSEYDVTRTGNREFWQSLGCSKKSSSKTTGYSPYYYNHDRVQSFRLGHFSGAVKEGLHQAIKCFRAMLNNQRGCSMVIKHPRAINAITLCLIHPSIQTKILVLDTLSAICLIVGGEKCVIEAFDNFKRILGEERRFQTLMHYFVEYQYSSQEECNVDFMISCVQLLNTLVNNAESPTLRVFLQEEFRHLGLDASLKQLSSWANDRLLLLVEAYRNNEIDVGSLLEYSREREHYQNLAEEREDELLRLRSQLATSSLECKTKMDTMMTTISGLQTRTTELEKQRAAFASQKSTMQTGVRDGSSQQLSTEERESEQKRNTANLQRSSTPSNPTSGNQSTTAASPPPLPVLPGLHSGTGGCPPPPPLLPGSRGTESRGFAIRPPIQTRYKLPILKWIAVSNNQLKGTIYVGMDIDGVLANIDTERFEETFRLSNRAVGEGPDHTAAGPSNSSSVGSSKRPEKTSLMDSNRHRCIAVLLHYLNSEKYTHERLLTEITLVEVPQDIADRIYHQLPTPDEVKKYLKYEFADQLPVDELADEDRLMLQLCKIERLKPRLGIALFMHDFEDQMKSVSVALSAVSSASQALRTSERLRAILEMVLTFGNYLNSSRFGIAYGFRMQSLTVLSETRSSDKSQTLLHYIADMLETHYQPLTTFYEDLTDLPVAAKVNMENLTAEVSALTTGFAQAEEELHIAEATNAPRRLVNFVRMNKSRIATIKQTAASTKKLYLETLEWFGESQTSPSPHVFFGYLQQFVEQYKKATVENERRRQMETIQALQSAIEDGGTPKTQAAGDLNSPKHAVVPRPARDRQLAPDARLAKRRYQKRTRQITSDGIMDEILADLVSEPLQAEAHPRRIRATDEVNGVIAS